MLSTTTIVAAYTVYCIFVVDSLILYIYVVDSAICDISGSAYLSRDNIVVATTIYYINVGNSGLLDCRF